MELTRLADASGRIREDVAARIISLSPRHFLEAKCKAPLLMVPTQE